MKILVLTVGRPKNKFLASMADDYLNRIHPNDFAVSDSIPDSSNCARDAAIERDGEKLLKKIKPNDRVILMREDGKSFTSVEFANFLSHELNNAPGRIVFVIGGPWGVNQAIKDRADVNISLSKMTFTHEMCYLFLCEQLYRAYSIIHGSEYHH